jgi:hypothetical protein
MAPAHSMPGAVGGLAHQQHYLAAQYHRPIVRKGKLWPHSLFIIAHLSRYTQCTHEDLGTHHFTPQSGRRNAPSAQAWAPVRPSTSTPSERTTQLEKAPFITGRISIPDHFEGTNRLTGGLRKVTYPASRSPFLEGQCHSFAQSLDELQHRGCLTFQ